MESMRDSRGRGREFVGIGEVTRRQGAVNIKS